MNKLKDKPKPPMAINALRKFHFKQNEKIPHIAYARVVYIMDQCCGGHNPRTERCHDCIYTRECNRRYNGLIERLPTLKGINRYLQL